MIAEADILSGETQIAEARCAHCNLMVPAGLIEPDSSEQFCCAGCRAVYGTLRSCGLDGYYKMREAAEVTPKPAKGSDQKFESFDDSAFEKLYVREMENGAFTTDLVLEGVQCAACVWLLERLGRVVDGVIEARLSLREATVRMTWDPAKVKLSRIARMLDRLGYRPHPARGQSAREIHSRENRRRMIHLGIAGALMGNTMLLALALYAGDVGHMQDQYRMFFRWISALLGMVSLIWPGATFFRSAIAAVRMRAVNLDVPIALALAVGGVAGLINVVLNRGEIYFDSLTVLVFLLLVGRFIQYRQQRRADDAVGLLFSLTPSSCRIVRGDEVSEAPIEALAIADVVEVWAGELFPADGVVEAGASSVNASLLTGESMPVTVRVGSTVHAGSQNVASTLRVRVTKIGRETRVGRLMDLIERGVQEKPPIVQFADRVGTWFLIVVSVAAALTFAWWCRRSVSVAIDHSVALLIVTCPCVLGLATPMTLAIAIGKLARRDILVKSGAALEKLSGGGEMILDKTGTITQGAMTVTGWEGDERLKGVVGRLEERSNHPVGRALYAQMHGRDAHATEVGDVVERNDGGISGVVDGVEVCVGSARYMRARGIDGTDGNAVLVAVNQEVRARVTVGDEVREDSADAVKALVGLGWRPSILSGDADVVAKEVGEQVGIEDTRGAVSPEEKLEVVKRSRGATTVMVGDGVNDAAALAAADVGIAVHGGAEASLAAADVYIARPGLTPLVDLVQTSQLAMRTIRRNLVVSLGYNLLAGALAAMGIMTPMIAAIIMPVSSATVMTLAVASIGRKGGARWK